MRIAVLRALQLGDLLCATPAWRALRAAYPDAAITLIGLPWARQLAAHFFDHFVEFPGFSGTIAGERYDLVLQLHGSGPQSNPFVARMAPLASAGYYEAGAWCPDPRRYLPWRPEEHEVLRWLRLLEHIGIPAKGTRLEFPLADPGRTELRLARYAVLHPGSQLPSRRWPAERFAEVGDALARDGLRIVITGSAGEKALSQRITAAMREPAIDLAGRTSLGGLAAIIAGARLLVCNDTGVSHIAAATRTPSVVIACGSDPRRWAPLDRELHTVLSAAVPCRPCMHHECPIGHPCALRVHPRETIAAARKALLCAA